jgi:hypothetical protein
MLKKPWQKMKVCSHTHPQQFPCVLLRFARIRVLQKMLL